jgi:hypothetical protein
MTTLQTKNGRYANTGNLFSFNWLSLQGCTQKLLHNPARSTTVLVSVSSSVV